jgi:ABC-2 type transport system permease protein
LTTDRGLVTEEFVEPGRGSGLLDVVRRRFLLRLIVRKELRVRYRGSTLGLAWSYVKPAVQFAVFYFALGEFLRMKESLPPFAVYLFSGVVVVNLFSEGLGNATRAVVGNAPLVKKIYLPRELFPVSSIWVALVHFLPQLVVLLVGAVVVGWRPGLVELGCAVAAVVIISSLALGLGLVFGALNVTYRDLENVVDLVLMIAVWLSPVLYSWTQVRAALGSDSWLLRLYLANPVTVAVELFHRAFWWPASDARPGAYQVPPDLAGLTVLALVLSGLTLLVGQLTFRRLEGRFAQEL